MATFRDPPQRILDLIERRAEPRFRATFLRVVRAMKDARTIASIERLIRQGRAEQALDVLEGAVLQLGNTYGDVYFLAGDEAAAFVGNALRVNVGFNRVNTRALAALERNQLRLISNFTDGQRAATRLALQDGIARELNPRAVARNMRDSIGLTPRDVQATLNYRRLLNEDPREALERKLRDRRFDGSTRRAARGERALSAQQIDTMVGRYRDRALSHRTTVIARTEALRSVNEGTEELYQQAVENGTIAAQDLQREWNTALDERVRNPAHTAMHGQVVGLNDSFVSGEGNLLRHPGDQQAPASETIQCRCALGHRFTDDAIRASRAA